MTHDRYFLDNVAGWILELDHGRGIPWEGNYSSWLEQKQERLGREEKAAGAREPHRIAAYLEDIAQMVNAWYHHHRVLGAPAPIERARLVLARASQIVLANGLALLGVTAPERM